jgi:thioester reductase-like protein
LPAETEDGLPAHRRIATMLQRQGVLLTGATGFLGQYLLRDLLLTGRPVAVLARDSQHNPVGERIAEILAFWSDQLGCPLPAPRVLTNDLRSDSLDLPLSERHWLRRHCRAVIHAAANLSFQETPNGEPWRTNVGATESLLRHCRDLSIAEWHQVSTAFVCGRRTGLITEDDLDRGQAFHNAYEESKFQAELLLRRTPGLRTTVYRPAVIVGDSRTGHTSTFTGLYRFLEMGVRLAASNAADGGTYLPLRLPLSGDEPWDLVPVDWVARAIVALLDRPQWHGRTFHLVARAPVATRVIRDMAAKELKIQGVEFAGTQGAADPTHLEELFRDGLREYWPYLAGSPVFAWQNTAAALPDLSPPAVDRPLLQRLIRFAVARRWGRGPTADSAAPSRCAEYIEQVFPRQARRSGLARQMRLDVTINVDVRGPGGGQWACKWTAGELVWVHRGFDVKAQVTYHTDTTTFDAVISGRQTPQEAFFDQRIDITGDLETALKLATLFGQFLRETAVSRHHRTEVMDASSLQR